MKTVTRRGKRRCESKQVSRKKEEADHSDRLSDDLLIHVLQMLPADVLHYMARRVCRRWFDLITDRNLLDYGSLILEKETGCQEVRLVDITAGEEQYIMEEENLEIPYNGRIRSWCDEYLLITDLSRTGSLFFYNIITKKGSLLPECSISCGGHYGLKCVMGLSCDSSKEVYKVVHMFIGPPIQCELVILNDYITTRNFSKWKKINGPIYTGQREYYWDDPVSVQGGRYFHWDVHCSEYLLSMDTVEERFSKTSLPVSDGTPMDCRYSFVEMGGFLTLLHKATSENFNIWVLKDFRNTKWEKLTSISMTSLSIIDPYRGFPVLVASTFKTKRYLIFRKPNGYNSPFYIYDLKDEVMTRLDIYTEYGERCIVQSKLQQVLVELR